MKLVKKIPKNNLGFALISTVIVMSLLALIAIGMLSIGSISTRTNNQTSATLQAKANARIALIKAIAQLQSLTGPDTRVTASSRLLDENNVAAYGVWRSWEGINHGSNGRAIAPDYSLKNNTGDATKAPADSTNDGRFLGWLGSTTTNPSITDLSDFSKTANNDYIAMLDDGSVLENDDKVFVKPTYLNNKEGAIAHWITGNNTKAMINAKLTDNPTTIVESQQRIGGANRADAKAFGLELINDRDIGAAVPSTRSLELLDPTTVDVPKEFYHDMTTFARGLQTNVATGGWKKDLSVLSEQYDLLPTSNLPVFTLTPGNDINFSRATDQGSFPNEAILYPWASYRSINNAAWGKVPPICSWTALTNYAKQYQHLTSSSASKTTMSAHASSLSSGDRFDFQERIRRVPQIARIQWIFSLCSEEQPAGSSNAGEYKAGIMITPVLTIWNPYNVELTISSYQVSIARDGIVPLRFAFTVDGVDYPLTPMNEITKTGNTTLNIKVQDPITLKPGENKVFSLADKTAQAPTGTTISLEEGYTPQGGFRYYNINEGSPVYADPSADFSINDIAYNTNSASTGSIGIFYNIVIRANNRNYSQAHRMGYRDTELAGGGQGIVEQLYPSINERASVSRLDDVDGDSETLAFASAIFGYRMATPISTDPKHEHLYSKGMLLSNPLTYYTEIGKEDNEATPANMEGSGTFHPINSAYDFAFLDVNGWNDTQYLPQVDPSDNSGYIVSGLTAGTGVTRSIMAELPTRPLQSLAQLQHFDARNNNPIPPFQFNMIGNGSAHPLFEPDEVFNTLGNRFNHEMVNDDTFLLNHLLFDDWFVSSIAPDLTDHGNNEDRDITTVYNDHVNGTTPLPNRFYIPTSKADEQALDSEKDANNTNKFTYETIASQLEVDGMFNINSVSVEAWKALLKHSRDSEVPYLDANGAINRDSKRSYPYPRTTIAGDQSTDSGSTLSNPLNPNASLFSGYVALTEEQIDALAEEIVKEIRLRGPFLSLSEFVNRRLTSDKDLAIAGTIQKALDNLADLGVNTRNPFNEIQSEAHEITSLPPGDTNYKFEEAALGSSAFGVPGWIRQADILTPLAPIITARDDTFTIRAYGDVRNPNTNEIIAKAWCEAVVKRSSEYLDPSDLNTVAPHSAEMTSETNKKYGRKYNMISFRWLNEDEI